MKKLVIVTYPNLEQSTVNKAWVQALGLIQWDLLGLPFGSPDTYLRNKHPRNQLINTSPTVLLGE